MISGESPFRSDPDPETPASATAARALEGDLEALCELFHRHRGRIRRIVSIRLAVRLAQVLEAELSPERWRSALRLRGDGGPASEAELVRRLAQRIEDAVRGEGPAADTRGTREPRRTLLLTAPGAERLRHQDLERAIDARVADLEHEEEREALLLRDYCGADWELIRARLGLLSREAAQALYRRAHARLARRLQRQPPRG